MQTPQWAKPFVLVTVLLAGLIPVALYLWVFGRVSVLSADAAVSMLNDPSQNAVLVDVRSEEEYEATGIPGSRHWPAGEIASLQSLSQMPADLAGRKLLLICNSGVQSALAAAGLGRWEAGMCTWSGAASRSGASFRRSSHRPSNP